MMGLYVFYILCVFVMSDIMMNENQKRRLLKKWKSNLTRYRRYEKDWRRRVYRRWNIRVTVDLSENKEYYLNEIENAKKIINTLSVLLTQF